MGSKLGTILARAGHDVVLSYSRSQKKLERLAREAGGRARAGRPAEAVADSDAVLLAVHWSRIDDVLAQTGSLSRQTVLHVLAADDQERQPHGSRSQNVWRGNLGGQAAERTCGLGLQHRVFCGSHKGAKKTAAKLIRDVGFNPVDLGELSAARYIEPFSLLLAEIAYSGSAGPQLAYRFESLS